MTNFEKIFVCWLCVMVGCGVDECAHRSEPIASVRPDPETLEWVALVHEHCGQDEQGCEVRVLRCARTCDGIGGRMVELTSSVADRRDVCVCASPEGVDRYSGDFSEHVRVTQTFCLDSE